MPDSPNPPRKYLVKLLVNGVVTLLAIGGLSVAIWLIVQDRNRRAAELDSLDEDLAAGRNTHPPSPPPANPAANPVTPSGPAAAEPPPPNTLGRPQPGQRVSFREVPAPPAALVGLELDSRLESDTVHIHRLRGIFQTAQGRQTGRLVELTTHKDAEPLWTARLEAQDGYAVGAIEGRYGSRLEAVRLIFMRQQGTRLDPADSYPSRWVGWNNAAEPLRVDSNGRLVAGVAGTGSSDWDSLELIPNDE